MQFYSAGSKHGCPVCGGRRWERLCASAEDPTLSSAYHFLSDVWDVSYTERTLFVDTEEWVPANYVDRCLKCDTCFTQG